MTDPSIARALEPCPFCKHEVPAVSDGNNGLHFRVICGNGSCRAAGPLERCAADAVSAWNVSALTPPGGDRPSAATKRMAKTLGAEFVLNASSPPEGDTLSDGGCDFAWTQGAGAYKHYPQYVNVTGNRLTVRGPEFIGDDGHYCMGPTVSIDLPPDVRAALQSCVSPK